MSNSAFDNFIWLSVTEKILALHERGIYMMDRWNTHFHIILYYYEGIYVEVMYHKAHHCYGKLHTVRVASVDKVCDLYLHPIDLNTCLE